MGVTVVLADDHLLVRQGVRALLEREKIEIVGEASDGLEAIRLAQEHQPDVVVLDLSMPGMSGLEVLKQLKKKKSSIPILVLSRHPEEQYAVRVLKAGADGYLTKESAPNELALAIQKIARGGKYISASLADQLASYIKDESGKKPHERLSDREVQDRLRDLRSERGRIDQRLRDGSRP